MIYVILVLLVFISGVEAFKLYIKLKSFYLFFVKFYSNGITGFPEKIVYKYKLTYVLFVLFGIIGIIGYNYV